MNISELNTIAASALRPRQALTISQWSDAHRELSAKASAEKGRWKTSRTPYLREIMDVLSDRSPVKRVVFVKSAQVGGTEVALNFIGYVMHHAPGPMLVVAPTLEVRDRWIMQRLHPMLRESTCLSDMLDANASRTSANSKDIKDFPGGMLVLSGANSPSSLRSMPIRYVVCDEVDAFPWEVGNEGDPLGLVEQRTSNFPRRKLLLVSTPTVKDASRIEDEYNASDRRRYHVPCPHCNEFQPLVWGNLKWSPDVRQCWYVCVHCGASIEEFNKPAMLAAGKWVAENPGADVRGYHINGLYAPIGLGFSWIELAKGWIASQGDTAKLKRFINTSLGESWEDRTHDIKPHSIAERAEDYALRTIPPGCLVITAGIDVQDDRLAVQIVGWGRNQASWTIDWLEIPGNPGREETWSALTELLNRPFINTYGKEMTIQAAAIDTGGHYTHEVYLYVRSRPVRRLMAIKGANTPGKPILSPRPSHQDINWRGKVIKNGVQLWTVGGDTAKHVLYRRITDDANVTSDGRKLHFPVALRDTDFFEQMVSEAFDPEKNRWVKRRGRRNEALDTWVYAAAAAHHPEVRVHAMRGVDWDKLARVLEPEGATPSAETQEKTEPAQVNLPDQFKTKPQRRRGGFVKGWK